MSDPFYEPTRLHGAPGEHTPAYAEADLTTCDREPIHIPGAVQPHGLLLAVDAAGRITTASANVKELLGPAPEDLIGLHLADALGNAVATSALGGAAPEREQDLFTTQLPTDHAALFGSLAGARVDVRTHRTENRLVIEIEDLDDRAESGLSLRAARRAIGRLAGCATIPELADQLAREIQALLGFDRVMVYRFDEHWNGEVIAEDRREDLNPFLGLHYPATDIPAQARRLYTVNWTRLIPDIGYVPVPLTPVVEEDTGAPLDLSFSSLRSVSPIHIEYLGNMGVTASMSVSIMVEEQLWGLVACHHYSGPLRPSHDARSAAELLGQVASQMFFDREKAGYRESALDLGERLGALFARVEQDDREPVEALIADPALADLFAAGGVAVNNGEQRASVGAVPPWPVLERIAELLEDPEQYATTSDDLAALDETLADHRETAAGALRIGSAPDRWMLWLRPEIVQTVDWGGDPTNKLLAQREGADVRLSPRKSFEKWQQTVRGRSRSFGPADLETAALLGQRMQVLILGRAREQMAMAESLQRSVVLDRAPSLPGVDVAARYLPASTIQLAGDWWDAVELDGGKVALVVGDVAGHGVQAASTMLQLRTSLRAYLFEGHDPVGCLDRLDAFVDRMEGNQIATAVVAIVDPVAGVVDIGSAGHPPVILSAGSASTSLDASSRPLLGAAVKARRGAERIRTAPGEALLLYTDGLIERRGESLDDSLARLLDPELAVGNGTLDEWLDRLLGRLQDRVGPDRSDDTTLLAFRLG